MVRGHRGSLILRCRALTSPSSCRFIPALCSSTRRGSRGVSGCVGFQELSLCVGDLDAGRVGGLVSSSACTVSPVLVVVAAMVSTITSWLVRGLPRQFIEMWENSRCSILFHLLVPGGRWHTVIGQAGLGGERGEFGLPLPGPVPVGAAAVRADQQPGRVGVQGFSDLLPPGCDGVHRERGGVVVGAHRHPPGVGAHVVDPVRVGLAQFACR